MISIGNLIRQQTLKTIGKQNLNIDKIIENKIERHNQEILSLERRLEEYRGLISEKQIKIEESYLRIVKRLKLIGFEHFGRTKENIINKIVFPDPLDDWDFSTDKWEIDPTRYVSPPSSLKVLANPNDDFSGVCKNANTLNVKYGRIVTYAYAEHSSDQLRFVFRNQGPVGSVNMENTYYLEIDFVTSGGINDIYLCKNVNGGHIILEHISFGSKVLVNEWNHLRATWWYDASWKALVVRLEKGSGSPEEWEQLGPDLIDEQPSFEDSDINRVGFWYHNTDSSHSHNMWLDDFEVWIAS